LAFGRCAYPKLLIGFTRHWIFSAFIFGISIITWEGIVMDALLSQFHLLRPYWLVALIPAFILFIALLKRRLASARWNGIIDEALMPHVLDQMPTEQSRWPLWFVLFAWILAVIALSGPTWQKIPHPVQKKDDSLVIVLDMSLSMAAQDLTPDRATRARQKIIDILKQRKEGLTALVVYAGDAYTVTPLTDDADTIINLVPALSPFIMPAMGSRPDKALALANKLVIDSGLQKADFLLITDGIQTKDIARIKKSLGNNSQYLSVLTIGTEEGAPIAMQGQGFMRDKQGNIVLPKLDLNPIKQLSSELNIRWHPMSFDDKDWQYLLEKDLNSQSQNNSQVESNKALEREFDLWADQGYWLIPFILFIAAFSFRRGWMLSLVFVIGLQPDNSYAEDVSTETPSSNESSWHSFWQSAWNTKDQQGQKAFTQDPASAAELFEDPNWKASSYYRAGDYEQAANYFAANTEDSSSKSIAAENHYNRGNALAKAGKLEDAINAYEKALELNDTAGNGLSNSLDTDAQFNKQLVEELLKQQEQQDSDDSSGDDSEKDSEQNSDKKDSDKNDSDKNDSENKDSDNQSEQNQDQSQDQKNSDNQDSDNDDSNEKNQQDQNEQKDQGSEKEKDKEKPSDSSKDNSEEKNKDINKEQSESEQQNAQAKDTDELSREERQALEQWLNRIPDDPGGLLKRKFKYQYQQRDHQEEGEVLW
jgi:Ca-activated chloride channel family protein